MPFLLRAGLAVATIVWLALPATADAMVKASYLQAPATQPLAAPWPVGQAAPADVLPLPDLLPPTPPRNVTMTGATQTTITLAWDAAFDDVGVAGYRMYRAGLEVGTTQQTRYAYTGLTCGSTYELAIRAYDAAGNQSLVVTTTRSTTACSVSDTTPPSMPPALTMTAATRTSISLDWNASSDNVGVTGYRLYRDGTVVGTTTQTDYTFDGLTCGRTYTLAVEAYDAAGNVSARASTVRSTTACPDTTPPSSPTGYTMSGNTQTTITMQWNAATDNVGVTGYRIFRNGTAIATTTQTSYQLTGLACGTQYVIALEAYDAAGNASNRNEATSTRSTAACPTPTPTPTPTVTPTPTPTVTPTPTPTPPPAGTAHLYVDTNGGSCTRQGAPGSYSDAGACPNFNAAFQAASPGDLVRVRPGAYGNQTFSPRTNTGAQIEFRADGGTVSFGSVNVNGADRITFRGPFTGTEVKANSCGSGASQCLLSRNIVWVGLTLDRGFTYGKAVDLLGAAVGWTFRDFDICCTRNDKIVNIDNFYGSDGANPNGMQANQSTDIVFEFGSVHSQVVDVNGGSGGDVHTECFWLLGPQSLVMRGVHSYGCNGTMNMNFSDTGDALVPGNLTIESSIFEPSMNDDGQDQGCVAQLGTGNALTGKNIIRNNLFQRAFCITNNGVSRDVLVANNIGDGPGCLPGFTYMRNRWTNGSCGSTDVHDGGALASSYYADAPKSDGQRDNSVAGSRVKGNWAYTGAGPHIDGGDSGQCAPWTILRARRSGACDQGPQEFGATAGMGAPTANFTRSGSTFDAGASVDPDGTLAEYRWTFNGVAQTTSSSTLTRTVSTGDVVTLSVVDNAGNASGLKTIKVL